MHAKSFICLSKLVCGINFFEVEKIHPRNKRNFYIKIFVNSL